MKNIFGTLYGSHLFGCAVPESDQDYKHIHLEGLRELLFEDTHAVNDKTPSEEHGKVEEENYSLRFYLHLLSKGQVIATDMFFAPKRFWVTADPIWEEIQELRPYVITRNIAPFAGYAKSQSFKYGKKGTKLLTVQKAISLLEHQEPFDTLCETMRGMEGVRYSTEHAAGGDIRHLIICGKSFGETTAYNLWLEPLKRLEAQYGERARLSQSGLDLKAQYHTVRICCEAIELLLSGMITFPRPEASLLLKIRTGQINEEELRELVDAKLGELTVAMQETSLPGTVNQSVVDDFIFQKERDYIKLGED